MGDTGNDRGVDDMDREMTWRSRTGPLPGGGPWLILEDCPAALHNTVHSAKGRDSAKAKCICPRARAALYDHQRAEQVRNRARDAKRRAERRAALKLKEGQPLKQEPGYLHNVRHGIPTPNLMAGLCRTPSGLQLMDSMIGKKRTAGKAARIKKMCKQCPVFDACHNWVMTAETPGGSWGGWYAGMGPRERENVWLQEGKTQ